MDSDKFSNTVNIQIVTDVIIITITYNTSQQIDVR